MRHCADQSCGSSVTTYVITLDVLEVVCLCYMLSNSSLATASGSIDDEDVTVRP